MIWLSQFLRAAGTKDRLMMTAVAADMHAHVFDNAQNRHLDFFKHDDAFFSVDQRDVLRRGDHHSPRDRNVLRQSQLNVTGTRRHIQHEVIQIRPQRLL